MTPRIARWIVIAAAAAAVLVAFAGRGEPKEPELVLRYFYSTDATELVEPLIERYNTESHRFGGREVRIDGKGVRSGEAEAALAAGDERAELWTPASTLWGTLLNHNVAAEWVPAGKPVSLVYSPQVIVMWKSMAKALGYPAKKIGWKDILDLATSKRSWADYGHPEYGRFLLGHTNPGYSTSGLSAVASDYYAVTGKRSGLTLADVQQPQTRARVRAIERSIVHYGETADNLLEKMLLYRRGYAHAAYVQETNLLKLPTKQTESLVAIDPSDGTFVADYPLYVLTAPWMNADARAAAEDSAGGSLRRSQQRTPPDRLSRPSAGCARRARAAGARRARRDPGRVARGPQAGQYRRRDGHVELDGRGRAAGGGPAGAALVPAGALVAGPVRARHLRRPSRRTSRSVCWASGGRRSPVRSTGSSRPATSPSTRQSARRSSPCAHSTTGAGSTRSWCSPTGGTSEGTHGAAPEDRGGAGHGRHRRSHLHRRLRHVPGLRDAGGNRVGVRRRVLLRWPEGHQRRLPEDPVLLLRQQP